MCIECVYKLKVYVQIGISTNECVLKPEPYASYDSLTSNLPIVITSVPEISAFSRKWSIVSCFGIFIVACNNLDSRFN